jgi:6-phosphofructokinase 1
MLATRFGVAAVQAAVDGASGSMVALAGDRIERVPIAAAIARRKVVDPAGDRVAAARAIDVAFGDETG